MTASWADALRLRFEGTGILAPRKFGNPHVATMLYMVNMCYKQGTPILRFGWESPDVWLWLVHAAVTRTGAVKVDLIPADVRWFADVKLDLILSCQIAALGAVKVDLILADVQRLTTADIIQALPDV